MVARFDIVLERSGELDENQSSKLKAGSVITIRQEAGGALEAITSEGLVLGTVPLVEAEKIQGGGFIGHIRTLQRQPGSSLIRSITIRFTAGEKALIQPVANDDEIRRFLRDERLQNVIKDIDSAQNRETALKSMLKAPNFKEFTDKVLGRIAPPEFLEMND